MVDDSLYLPEELERALAACVQETKPDTEAIKAAVLRHEEVTGAEARRGSHLRVARSLFRGVFRFYGFLGGRPTFQLPLPHPFSCLGTYEPLLGRRQRSDLASGCFRRAATLWPFVGQQCPSALKTGISTSISAMIDSITNSP